MKQILSVFAALALLASQISLAQARPIETSTPQPEMRPTLALMPDAVALLNPLTIGTPSGGLGWEADFAPAQDDNPPRIGFVPPILYLYPYFFPDVGTIVGASIDLEFPYIVPVGSAAAFGSFNVAATFLDTYFDYFQIQLPTGELEIGIGFVAVAGFEAYFDYYHVACPCGHFEIFAVDWAGNTAIGGTLALAFSIY